MTGMRTFYSASDVLASLSGTFVLFVGSAISGVSTPHLPMAENVSTSVLDLIVSNSVAETYGDYVVAQRARALVDSPGQEGALREKTKFEEFLWYIDKAAGAAARSDLLARLYVCGDGEFGCNHVAIGAILQTERCLACLTTNFDNAIEQACPELKDRVCSYPAEPPRDLARANGKPLLIKLHGDAALGTCVSIAPELSEAAQLKTHAYLESLLEGQTLLVLGYSGMGDIDIAPHLERVASKAVIVWGCPEGGRVPRWATYRWETDLSRDIRVAGSGRPGNGLLELAHALTGKEFEPGNDHEWKAALRSWPGLHSSDRRYELVVSMCQWRQPWPIVELLYHAAASPRGGKYWLKRGWAEVQLGTYFSALGSLHRAKWFSLDPIQLGHANQGIGFARWRLKLLRLAACALHAFVESPPDSSDEASVRWGGSLRNYLEVCADILRFADSRAREKKYVRFEIDRAVRRIDELRQPGPQDDLLVKIVKANLNRLWGQPVDIEEVSRLYEECMALRYYSPAAAAARVLVKLDLARGREALNDVEQPLRDLEMEQHIRQNGVALDEALHGEGRRWSRARLKDGMAASFARVIGREVQYLWRRRTWRRVEREWSRGKKAGAAVSMGSPS